MTDYAAKCEILERENEMLREENASLRALRQDVEMLPRLFGFTTSEERFVQALLARGVATKEQLHFALYGQDLNGGAEIKIIDVFVCKVRRKLKPYGILISTIWGCGYEITPEMKAQMRLLCASMRGQTATSDHSGLAA